jgi:outer membrane protein OmpA-like peptidoglycan-associated protein
MLFATALMLGAATTATAQKPGAVEIGGFGRYTKYDTQLHLDDRVGIGARLGVFVLRNLALEGDASYTATYTQGQDFIRAIPIHARLVYNLPVTDHTSFLIGGGYVRNMFRKGYVESANGFGGLLGLRLGMGDVLSIRLDATGDYVTDPKSKAGPYPALGIEKDSKNFHYAGQAGLSLLFGAKRDGDKDHDGVKDSLDECPDTPRGDAVDAKGCSLPKDADRDGVTDNLDKCPTTPAGEKVDAAGCTLPKDADGDGVVDASDKCPNTPAGTAVDATGCPKDSDGDGVADTADKCPNTPAGTAVDANGCPKDTDGDGVADTADKCPNTPAGTAVDATGCPKDSDADGVTDALDKCPNTAAGTAVDAVGCEVLFKEGKALILQGVNFATGKATLLPESQTILDRVAESLTNNPTVTVEVGGHTDNTGRKATNVRLSEARANAVRDYLISKGVDGARITAKGYGPDQPVAENTTVEGRAANRRVELSKTN